MILCSDIFKTHRIDPQAAREIGIHFALLSGDKTEACRRKYLNAFDEELRPVLVKDLGPFDRQGKESRND